MKLPDYRLLEKKKRLPKGCVLETKGPFKKHTPYTSNDTPLKPPHRDRFPSCLGGFQGAAGIRWVGLAPKCSIQEKETLVNMWLSEKIGCVSFNPKEALDSLFSFSRSSPPILFGRADLAMQSTGPRQRFYRALNSNSKRSFRLNPFKRLIKGLPQK